MSIRQRTYQGGSVVSFIIVGVILAAGLVGVAYYLDQRGEQVRKDQAIAVSDQQKKIDEEATKSENTKKSDETTTKESNNNTAITESAEVTSPSTGLPVTGPEAIIGELASIFLLTVSTVSYLSSRRNQRHSL